jgi:ABC-type transport system involved in cytochrome c biogenesis permease subunit
MVDRLTVLNLLRVLVPSLYAAGACGYLAAFARNKPLYSWVRPTLLWGIAAHVGLFAALYAVRGHFPASTVFEGLVFSSLAVSMFHFGMERAHGEAAFGAFLWPVNLALTCVAVLFLDRGEPLPRALVSPYFVYHVTAFFVAYACFLFSFAVSVMYLLQYRAIATRTLGPLYHRMPSLDVMDRSIMRADAIGLGLMLMGLALGYVWLELSASSTTVTMKAGFAILTSIAYFSEHILRNGQGWTGRRTCYISMVGFVLVILTLLVGRHGY